MRLHMVVGRRTEGAEQVNLAILLHAVRSKMIMGDRH